MHKSCNETMRKNATPWTIFLSLSIFHAHSMHTFCIISSLISPKGIECRLCLYVYEYVVKWPCWHTSTKRNPFFIHILYNAYFVKILFNRLFLDQKFSSKSSVELNHNVHQIAKKSAAPQTNCVFYECVKVQTILSTINVAEFYMSRKKSIFTIFQVSFTFGVALSDTIDVYCAPIS